MIAPMHADENFDTTPEGWPTAPRRVLQGVAATLIASGFVSLVTVAVPHENERHDRSFILVSIAIILFGAFVQLWARRPTAGLLGVHVVNVVASGFVLALTWLGMVDVAGIQAIILFIPLAISASFGPLRWSITLLALQSLGYAGVLATADVALGLDRVTQWMDVTIGLAIGLLYQDLMRRQIAAAARRGAVIRAERDAHREARAAQLQLVNDQLAAANDLKDRFVAMASHELRTPLTSISGFSTTMVDRWDSLEDADKLRFVRIIEEQSDRLGRLVSDLLTLAKIEEGRIDTDATPIDLAPVIRNTIDHLGLADVAVECDPAVQVAASPDHVEQILVNLIGNATNHGASQVAVHVFDTEHTDTTIVVADDGPGVAPAFVPHLFRRFTRGAEQSGHASGGSGLGLSIVDGLSTAYGGEAWYEPNEPAGSRFCVRLPNGPTVS